MAFQLPELPAHVSASTYGVIGIVAAIAVIAKLSQRCDLNAFPTVGSSTLLGSWWAGFKYLINAQIVIQDGYDKHKSVPFKVSGLNHWIVILSDRAHLEELAKASDDELSCIEAINDQIQFEHMLGPGVIYNPNHAAVTLSNITRNIEPLYPEIREEIVASFADILNLRGNEWKSVPALSSIEKIVCRTSNRLFVGLPLCRNPEWVDLIIQYSFDSMKGGVIVGLLPQSIRPMAARLLSKSRQSIRRGVKLLGPVIEERQKYVKEYGKESDDKPKNLIAWLMEEAKDIELTTQNLTTRVLVVNLAAVYATSNSFVRALFYLAAYPQHIQPLREEVEAVIEKEGWSKAALGKMQKIDSFLKECQRLEGINLVTLARKTLKDFTFSDGTFIPKGTSIGAATQSLHHDEDFYEDPDAFKPFRFAEMQEDDSKGLKHQFVSTTADCLSFGLGKHACPGRFFASSVMKSLLAHIVVTYDVKLEDDAAFPHSFHIGTLIAANLQAKVMFRNRVD